MNADLCRQRARCDVVGSAESRDEVVQGYAVREVDGGEEVAVAGLVGVVGFAESWPLEHAEGPMATTTSTASSHLLPRTPGICPPVSRRRWREALLTHGGG